MRKLTLRKEALAELSTDEMTKVVGGGTLKDCVDLSDVFCPTDPCITTPVTQLRCLLSLEANYCS